MLEKGIKFEYPGFTCQGAPFIPKIFDGGLGEAVPSGFNATRVPLNGELKAHLDWDFAFQEAKRAQSLGLKLLWDLDLGLFSRLNFPLSHEMQWNVLLVAVQSLIQRIQNEFLSDTIGVVVYRGKMDFSSGFPWDPAETGERNENRWWECRALSFSFLQKLVNQWPDALQPFLLLDGQGTLSMARQWLLTHRDFLWRFALGIKGGNPGGHMGWNQGASSGFLSRQLHSTDSSPLVKVGVCLPTLLREELETLDFLAGELKRQSIAFRVVTESFLTGEWEGLETLIVPSEEMTQEGRRKLQGFCAAGGQVVSPRGRWQLPQELSLENFFKKIKSSSMVSLEKPRLKEGVIA